MALPKNRQAVQELLRELEPMILGKEHEGFTCDCGAIHSGAAKAVAIDPAGDTYPGQEILWYMWRVDMQAHDKGSDWSCGLSSFLDADELKTMFKRYFGEQEREESPYNLKVDGADRVHANLSAAVRVQENDSQIRFSFSWGREQDIAIQLGAIDRRNSRRKPAGSEAFLNIVNLLGNIQPEVYHGGPDPELAHESKWHLQYKPVLEEASSVANHIFFQNIGSTTDYRGKVCTSADVVFMKHEVR